MRDLVELGLTRPESDPEPSPLPTTLHGMVDRLLATLAASAGTALEAEEEVVSAFVSRLDACRHDLRAAAGGDAGAAAIDAAIRAIEHFLRSSHRYVSA